MLNNKFRDKTYNKPEPQIRINFQIKAYNVRLVHEGKQLGVMPIEQARRHAADAGLDLVEIVPNAQPPVCEIKDFSRWQYEEKLKIKNAKKKQKEAEVELKQIRLRSGIAQGDVDVKLHQAQIFLDEGKSVQFNLEFKGAREMANREVGFALINRIVDKLKDIGNLEKVPKLEGKKISCKFHSRKTA